MGQCYGGISSIKIHSFLNDSSLDHIDKNLTGTVTSVIKEIVNGKADKCWPGCSQYLFLTNQLLYSISLLIRLLILLFTWMLEKCRDI